MTKIQMNEMMFGEWDNGKWWAAKRTKLTTFINPNRFTILLRQNDSNVWVIKWENKVARQWQYGNWNAVNRNYYEGREREREQKKEWNSVKSDTNLPLFVLYTHTHKHSDNRQGICPFCVQWNRLSHIRIPEYGKWMSQSESGRERKSSANNEYTPTFHCICTELNFKVHKSSSYTAAWTLTRANVHTYTHWAAAS